nr:SpaA isopeptide-forming pilin-related protein [Parvimonas parva]
MQNGNPVKGQLKKWEGQDVEFNIKDEDSIASYSVNEVKANGDRWSEKGYDEPIVTKKADGLFEFENRKSDGKTHEISILKVQEDGNTPLKGAQLAIKRLFADGGGVRVGTAWMSDGKSKKLELGVGDYQLEELAPPTGYDLATSITFRISEDGKVSIKKNDSFVEQKDTTIKLINKKAEPKKYSVKIQKVTGDEAKQEALPGARLQVLQNGVQKDIWNSLLAPTELKLEPGNYTLKEIKAPEGYGKLTTDIAFTVEENGKIFSTTTGTDVFTIEDNLITIRNKSVPYIETTANIKKNQEFVGKRVSVKKGSEDSTKLAVSDEISYSGFEDGSYVALATLIKNHDENQIVSKNSTEFTVKDGKSKGVVNVELSFTKENLELDKNEFTVLEEVYRKEDVVDGEAKKGTTPVATHRDVKDEQQTVIVDYVPNNFVFNFYKIDQNSNPLAGARLKITTDKGIDVPGMVWNSLGQQPTPVYLSAGSYILKEIKTPDGFTTLEDTPFTVSEDGEIKFKDNKLITSESKPDGTSVKVTNTKKDIPKPEELKEISISKQNLAGEEIEGAKIQIKTLDGQVVKGKLGEESDKDLSWTSGKTSQKISLKAGTYIFHEETAPKGYTTVTDIKFTVDNDGKISDLKFFENGKETKVPTENESKVEGETKLVVKDKIEEKAVINTSIGFDGKFAKVGQELNLTKDKAGTDKTVEDKITYKNLPSGQKYTFKADLYEFPLDANEWKKVGSSNVTVDVPESGSGETKVKFETITLNGGSKYTVVVKVESNNNLLEKEGKLEKHIINHNEGKNDKAETIIVEKDIPQPEEPKKKDIVVSKVQLGDDNNEVKEVVGAKIQIFEGENKGGKKVDEWTTESGKNHEIKGLEVGKKYTLHEEVAPNGLKVVTDFVFTVDENGNVKVETILTSGKAEFKDGKLIVTDDKEVVQPEEPKKKDIVVSKVQLGDDDKVVKEVVGAKIQIFEGENTSGKKVDEWTTESGKNHEVKGLEVGKKYTLHEEVAPNGLKVVTDFVFTVDENGNVKVETILTSGKAEFKDGKLIVTDDKEVVQPEEPKKKDIVVSKVQLGDDDKVVKEVVGATIQIFEGENKGGKKVDEWTTESGKNHEVKGLEVGKKYTLHEEVAPNGLKVVTDFVFTVDENGNVKVETTLTSGKAEFKDGKLIVTDDKEVVQPQEPKKKDIVVSKVQLGDDDTVVKEVVGAKIQIFEGENTSGKKVDEWTTESGKNHEVKGLEVGKKYTLHEEVAPKGLKVVTDFVFTVDENGNVKVETILTSGKAEFKDGKLIVTDDKEVVQPEEPKPEEPKPEPKPENPSPKPEREPKMKKTSIGLSSSISMVLVGMAGLVISSKKRNK